MSVCNRWDLAWYVFVDGGFNFIGAPNLTLDAGDLVLLDKASK
ncbi:hypothetical protein [Mangrovibacterium lignilyticum]|nr:hypothetical protein [Mangrovibacterium lignilyticum]